MFFPAPGVRSRSILATSTHVELGVLGTRDLLPAHLVDPDGGILMRVPAATRAGDAFSPVNAPQISIS